MEDHVASEMDVGKYKMTLESIMARIKLTKQLPHLTDTSSIHPHINST